MNTDPDVPAASLSIWPHDTWMAADKMPARDFRRLRCFVLCRFDRAGTILPLIRHAAKQVGNFISHEIQVYFAGDIVGSSAIHPDIWAHTLQADIVIADITGYNPNVMYELGTAAAWRPLPTVIIVRDKCDGESAVFDIQPARQILYESSSREWMSNLTQQLIYNIQASLVLVPFQHEPESSAPSSFRAPLDDGKDTSYLWSPGPAHRCLLNDGLEFGSPHYFPYSWISPPRLRPTNVLVKAEMRFSFRLEKFWIGIAVRSQGYTVNNEHLVWLNQEGKVFRTGPAVDGRGKDEHRIGQLPNFDLADTSFIPFAVSINDTHWQISVREVDRSVPLAELPQVFPLGRIMFQTYNCRAVIRKVSVNELK